MTDPSSDRPTDELPTDVRSELAEILSNEFNAAGIANRLIPESMIDGPDGLFTMPAQIAVPLDTDEHGSTPEALVYFLPVFDDPAVVQYMIFFDYDVEEPAISDLARFIALVNSQLTITGFEMSESIAAVVFRHSHAIGTQPLDPGTIAWPLSLIRETIDNYGALVRFVAGGGDFDVAVSAIRIG
jgi:hypothetical protein